MTKKMHYPLRNYLFLFMLFSDVDTTIELPIMEHFYTIQGEGFYSGRAAYFVRLAGCDIGCVWCDVKDSWDAADHPILKIDEIIQIIKSHSTKFVVITGGEPALYDLTSLIETLSFNGIETAIETSGCYHLKGNIDWYCFSPKKFKPPCEEAYTRANELKVVIYNESDFEWAEKHASKVNSNCILFLQPEWSRQDRILPVIIDYIKSNPKWRISLQTHKFMQIP
jgi:7-carboxy-7-deazaguanine synthase